MKYTVRKTLAVLLAAVFTLMLGANAFPALLPRAFADEIETGDCGDDVTYTWNTTTGVVTISGSGPMLDYSTHNPSPFYELHTLHNIKTVVIDHGVTAVGEWAFYSCESLESVTFPVDGSFKTIGKDAFIFCSALTDVTLPQGLKTIGESAFEGSGLTSVTIPGTVTQIGKSAFYGIDSLTSVTIPKSVTAILECAFGYCADLETINYAGSPADWAAMTIHENAFYKTPVSEPTCYYYGVEGAENAINDVGVNDGSDAYLARLATAWAVYNKLSDGDKAKVTNANALQTAIVAASGYEFGSCGDCVGYAWNKTTGKVVIGGSGPMWDYDDEDNPSPFNESGDVRAIVIESGVTSVGEYAFRFCVYLQDVSFPYGLETIGKGAFLSTGLKNASLPRTVTRIGESAFLCADLVSVTLPKGLTAIQDSAFFFNEYLQTLNYTGSPADWDAITIGEDAFEDTPLSAPTCYYYGVDGAMNAIDAIGENDGSDAYLARIAVAAIACMNLTDAEKDMVTNVDVLGAAFRTVRDYSFDVVCGDLVGSAINFSTKEVIIGGFGPMRNDAARQSFFENNPKYVKTLAVTEGVTGVATRMFKNCDQLESVTLPMSMKTIDQRAFADCSRLTTINYPGGPADWNKINIAADAFDGAPVSEPTCYYYGVQGAMNAIDDIGDVVYTAACKGRIDAARKAYDRLSDYETTLVTNHQALVNAENAYNALEAEALIAAIGTVEYTDACKEKIDAAQAAYEALTDEQKALVDADAVTALENANTAYNDLKAAADTEALIAAIGTVTYTDESKTKIDAAQAAYEALTADQQALVDADAVTALADANTAYNNLKAAADTEALIAAIGTVEYTAECKEKIDAAKAAYDALTDAQKALVDPDAVTALNDASAAYALLENKAAFADYRETVKALADGMKLEGDSDACTALIEAAKAAVDALAYDESKTLDENEEALDEAAALTQLAADLAAQRAAEADDPREAFEAYRETLLTLAQALRKEGDSEAVTALIDEAVAALTDYVYDDTKELDENVAVLDDVMAYYVSAVRDLRHAERQAILNKQPCSLCGKHHTGSLLENFIGVIHGIIWILRSFALIAA